MSLRNIFSLVFAATCVLQFGCAACVSRSNMAGCGMCEASCACPDCGCADTCCELECGCPEPACGCVDECCDSCCGAPGCGTMVGQQCPLASCPLLQGLRNLICGHGCGCGCGGGGCCGGGCSCETYTGDWNCNPPCACEPCNQSGVYTGAQRSMPMPNRQMQMADRVNADEIRFSAQQKAMRR